MKQELREKGKKFLSFLGLGKKLNSGEILPLSGSGSEARIRSKASVREKHRHWEFLGAALSEFYFRIKFKHNSDALQVDFSTVLRYS